jgi:signal transduction histidine kinase
VTRTLHFPSVRPSDAAPSAAAKLALLEALSACTDVEACARVALQWLGVPGAFIAVMELDGARLVSLGAFGGGGSAPGAVLTDGAARDHPLLRAMCGPPFVRVRGSAIGEAHAASGTFTAMPLAADAPAFPGATGVLLVPGDVTLDRAERLAWLATHLGGRIGQVRAVRRLVACRRELSQARALVLSVIDAVSDPVLLTNTDGGIVMANHRAEAFFSSSRREDEREDEEAAERRRRVIAKNHASFAAALALRARGAAGGTPRAHELALVDPCDGSDRVFELLSARTRDAAGRPGAVSVLRNVTDLRCATEEIERNDRAIRVAEAEARAERDRLDLIIDSVVDPILVTDAAGAIAMMNARAERLFTAARGAPRDVVRRVGANGAHFSSFVANLFFSSQGTTWKGDLGLVEPATGASMPVEAIAGKIIGDDGVVTHVVTILHDRREALENARLYAQLKEASDHLELKVQQATEELVRQNELLRRQATLLEQASQLKSLFLANMSHEFRTPLNAILGYTNMLLQGTNGELTPPQRRNLGRVDSNARHLLAIINDILDISRIEAGEMPIHVSEVRLSELIAEVIAELEPVILSRPHVRVSWRVSRMPRMRTDRQKIKQIVLNLLTNALKFTPRGSVEVVAVHDAAARTVTISVTDSGIGIAEQNQVLVFEDFRQVDDSPTREHGGTGLGLSICRRLATMLGGKLTLRSELGVGSVFALTIPRRLRRP